MTSTELRIGNLIQCYRNAFDKEKTQHKISGIFFLDEFGDCVELEDGFIININKGIEPIPLTEEWLEKFGFEFSEYEVDGDLIMQEYFLNKGTIKYKVCLNSDSINEFSVQTTFSEVMINNNLLYTHQLQNLYFALTGEELIVK